MSRALLLICAVAVAVIATVSACVPPDCDHPDYGTCGNACCNITVAVPLSTVETKDLLMSVLSNGGPDGRYKLSMTAEGTLGFADLRPYHTLANFLGQAIHHTKVHHYNDTVNMAITPTKDNTSIVTAFSVSGIAGAYGDAGQNFKNVIQIFRAFPSSVPYTAAVTAGCPGPITNAEPQPEHKAAEPEPENLHASCRLTWHLPSTDCAATSQALVAAAKGMSGLASCGSSEKCGYSIVSANSTFLAATHETPKHHYIDDQTMAFMPAGSSGCTVDAFSTSTIWYAVLDDGTNYCDLHNLISATGLQFTEVIDKSDCTQWATANCNKY